MLWPILLSLLLALFSPSDTQLLAAEPPQTPDPEALLQQGLEAEAAGNYEKALEIWLQAKPTLEHPSLAIARNYMRVATEQKLSDYYKAASALYQWGLSGDEVAPNKPALETELAFMDPLLEKETRKQWEQMLENNNPEIFSAMAGWWAARDLAPGTLTNERLVEHWQRIAYARTHFTRNDNSPYGTDDRGTAWVAYGRPDRTFTERLHLSFQEARRIADKFRAGASESLIAHAAIQIHQEPEVRIWVYLDIVSPREENLIFMFGPKVVGGFGELRVVEDLLPTRAFTLTQRYDRIDLRVAQLGGNPNLEGKVTPGMVLQWAYYRQLSTKDWYFAKAFNDMEREWEKLDNPYFNKHYGQRYQQKHFHEKVVIRAEAPEESSTLAKDFPSIPLEAHQYALLSEQNEPVFATFLVSRPQRAFLTDLAVNQDSMVSREAPDSVKVRQAFDSYQLLHGVELIAGSGRKLGGERHPALLRINGDDLDTPSPSGFMIPYRQDITQQFYAELRNTHPNTRSTLEKNRPDIDSPFPKDVRGVGTLTTAQPEPMEVTPGRLQLGELILGWDMGSQPGGLVPFKVAHQKQVPEGEPLALHLEAYHLQPGNNGLYGFTLSYEIRPVNFLGWTQERKDQLSITLNFEHDRPQLRENIEIQAADLPPGRYVLRVRARDAHSDNEAYREVEFKVVEE